MVDDGRLTSILVHAGSHTAHFVELFQIRSTNFRDAFLPVQNSCMPGERGREISDLDSKRSLYEWLRGGLWAGRRVSDCI